MRKLKIWIILSVVSVLMVACGGGGDEATSDTTDETTGTATTSLIVNSKFPDGNFSTEGLKEFSEKVSEKTNGELELDVRPGSSLGYDGPELLPVVRDGLVPISDIQLSEVAGDEPLFALTTLPFLMQTVEDLETFNEVSFPYFSEILEEKWNQKYLYTNQWPFAGFWTQEKYESIEEMQGLKMRTYDENGARVVEAIGGTPYPMPFSEVYSSLSTGVIDSVLTSSQTAVDGKFWEVLDYYIPTNVTAPPFYVTINMDEFNSLSDEHQQALVEAGEEMNVVMDEKLRNLNVEMEQIVQEEGIEIVEPSEEFMNDLNEIGNQITADWLENAPEPSEEILEEYNRANNN